jgi:hypothetical protein
MKKGEMGWACSMHGRNKNKKKLIQNFNRITKGKNHLSDVGVDGRIILNQTNRE